MKKLLITFLFLLAFAFTASAQTDEKPVCVSQETANKLFELGTKGKAYDVLKEASDKAIDERDKIIEDLKIKLAQEVQKNIDNDAEKARLTAIIEVLVPQLRKKCNGIVLFC